MRLFQVLRSEQQIGSKIDMQFVCHGEVVFPCIYDAKGALIGGKLLCHIVPDLLNAHPFKCKVQLAGTKVDLLEPQ